MMNSKLLSRLFTADIVYDKYSRNYRRLILLNALLYLTIVLSAFFTLFNFFGLENYLIAGMDFLVFCTTVYASYDVHRYKRLERAVTLFTAILFIFLISFTLVNQNENYGLIWTIFLPLVAILLMSRKKGLIIVIIFYLFIFSVAYEGIGEWQNMQWSLTSFLRFVAASAALTYIVHFMEYSHELAEDQLALTRKHEAESMKAMHELSIKDPLTQLYNRRHFNTIFTQQFQTAHRHHFYFALFILDIDFFKQYNDTYGHQEGDRALCKLAEALNEHLRRSEDSVFRLGGEEFSGICIGEDREKIVSRISSIIDIVTDLHIEHSSSSVSEYISVSIGIKIINSFEEYDFDRLYKEADEALYRAKQEGRNRYVFT